MRGISKKKLFSLFICLIFLLTAGIANAIVTPPDARVWIEPPSKTVSLGDPFSLDIDTEILSMDLYGAGIGLSFDPSILSFTGATEGLFLGGVTCLIPPCSFFNFVSGPGTIEIYDTLLGDLGGVTGSGTLATLAFNAIGLGTSDILFDFADFADSTPPPVGPMILDVYTTNGSVNVVNVVPEPTTLLLMGSGLVALGASRLKRRGNRKVDK